MQRKSNKKSDIIKKSFLGDDMNNEEFQKLILEQFRNINDRFDKLENGQTELQQNQTRMEYELLEKLQK